MESGSPGFSAEYFAGQAAACRLCPRMCRTDRRKGRGFCGTPAGIVAARAALHYWEEPCLSGTRGSGAVFFSGCTLRCRFCQNYRISQDSFGKALTPKELADVFLRLQDQGANNINLVTATQYLPWIVPALDQVRSRLHIPVVYNCGGYERTETVQALADYIDVWLPDLKYHSSALSARFSSAPDYFACASRAIRDMITLAGPPVFRREVCPEADGLGGSGLEAPDPGASGLGASDPGVPGLIMARGVIIRHLVLPGHRDDSLRLLHWMAEELPRGQFYISLMSQYTPYRRDFKYPELNRRITTYEYEKVVDAALELGLDLGFMQKKSSAKEEYTPPFDLEGL